MEGLRSDSSSCPYIASQLANVPFTVIDVGCSGGISPIWRLLGKQLRACGFDPNINECTRQSSAETPPGVCRERKLGPRQNAFPLHRL